MSAANAQLLQFVNIVGDEFSCPVCLEEFVEPKCLPNCAHNVCSQCLGRMIEPNSSKVECPECRVESTLPGSGTSLPTNHLLVRLIERTPGRKERKALKEALDKSKEKVETTEKSLKEMEAYCYEEVRKRGDELKCEISNTAENLVKIIRDQEKELLSQVDRFLSENYIEGAFQEHKREMSELVEKLTICSQMTEEVLQSGDVEQVLELKDVLVKQLEDFSVAVESRISEASQVTFQAELQKYTIHENAEDVLHGIVGILSVIEPGSKPRKCDQVIRTIGGDRFCDAHFTISVGAITVSENSGNIAVVDWYNRCVYLFNATGENCILSFGISCGHPLDITFSKGDGIIVAVYLDSGTHLFHYTDEGSLAMILCLPRGNTDAISLSTDSSGRLLVTCCYADVKEEGWDSYVLVYSPDLKYQRGNSVPQWGIFCHAFQSQLRHGI